MAFGTEPVRTRGAHVSCHCVLWALSAAVAICLLAVGGLFVFGVILDRDPGDER